MQHVPESRTQTFEEIYGPPENFLEIEVSQPAPARATVYLPVPLHRAGMSRAQLPPKPTVPLPAHSL